ncbi:MAG: alpha/beta hydrolase [Fimbriimonadaceae bacterium]|nr:alpha/beta hydrolase [Fimbriimonadaceae bacterium]QYK58259.1 MAG: alpha/beta hydrolase [Fimbriimonadaceae bacterium]
MSGVAHFKHVFRPGTGPVSLLMLHGTGGHERQLLGLADSLLPGAPVLSPLGQVREGTAPRFFRRFAEGVFDFDDLRGRTHELADWLAEAYQEYAVSPKVCAVGYSNGATVAASLLLMRPETLSGAVLLRPSVPWVPEELPDLSDKTVLLAGGRHDTIVDPTQADRLFEVFTRAGARAEHAWAEAGHELTQGDVEAARDCLSKKLSSS